MGRGRALLTPRLEELEDRSWRTGGKASRRAEVKLGALTLAGAGVSRLRVVDWRGRR